MWSGWRALKLFALSLTIATGFTPPSAHAQSVAASATPTPTKAVRVQTDDGWTFAPAFSGGRVIGFLATHDPSTIPSHTYSIIWYQRQADDTFTWEGWSGRIPAAAARAIAFRAGTLDMFQQPELNVAQRVAQGITGQAELNDEVVTASLVPMVNGVTAWSIFAQVMPLLTPETAESVVEIAAEGAVGLTAEALRWTEFTCGGGNGPNTGPTNGDPTVVSNPTGRSADGLAPDASALTKRFRYLASEFEWFVSEDPNKGTDSPQTLLGCCLTYGYFWDSPVVYTGCGPGQVISGIVGGCKYFCATCSYTRTWVLHVVCTRLTYTETLTPSNGCAYTGPVNSDGKCP